MASTIVACGGLNGDDDSSPHTSTGDGGADSSLATDGARAGNGGAQLTMTGSAGGVTLAAADAFGVITPSSTSGSKTRFRAVFEDRAALCSKGFSRQNATRFDLDLESPDATFKPGTFPIYDRSHTTPPYADAPLVKLNDACKPSPDRGATSGNVVITNVTDTSVSGTFDITYVDGHIQGSFTAPLSCSRFPETACAP